MTCSRCREGLGVSVSAQGEERRLGDSAINGKGNDSLSVRATVAAVRRET